MTPGEFWDLVDRSRGGSIEEQAERLGELLMALQPEALVGFKLQLDEAEEQLNDWRVWAAGYAMAGGMSDDGFDYFRTWVVSRGRAVHAAAVADPDSLAGVEPEDDVDGEVFGYVVLEVFEQLTGDEMWDLLPETEGHQPRGEPFEPESRAWFVAHLPRIAEKHL